MQKAALLNEQNEVVNVIVIDPNTEYKPPEGYTMRLLAEDEIFTSPKPPGQVERNAAQAVINSFLPNARNPGWVPSTDDIKTALQALIRLRADL